MTAVSRAAKRANKVTAVPSEIVDCCLDCYQRLEAVVESWHEHGHRDVGLGDLVEEQEMMVAVEMDIVEMVVRVINGGQGDGSRGD